MKLSKHKKSFGSVSKDYQKYRRAYDPEVYRKLSLLIAKQFKKNSQISILDIGCGTGKSTEPLLKLKFGRKKKNINVVGCDHDGKMIKEARSHADKLKLPINYIKGQAESLPFDDRTFDIVISGTAFHWFATPKVLHEIRRVLKNEGILFVFWIMHKKTKEPTVGLDVYKKYKWRAVPSKLRDANFILGLFKKNGFIKTKKIDIPYTRKYNLEDFIGGLKTSSSYSVMPSAMKKGFLRDMSEAFKKEVGGKYLKSKKETIICLGIKK